MDIDALIVSSPRDDSVIVLSFLLLYSFFVARDPHKVWTDVDVLIPFFYSRTYTPFVLSLSAHS